MIEVPAEYENMPKKPAQARKKAELPIHSLISPDLNFVIDEMSDWGKNFRALSQKLRRMPLEHPERQDLEFEFEMLLHHFEVRSKTLIETMDKNAA
jgi:hypothetical protein